MRPGPRGALPRLAVAGTTAVVAAGGVAALPATDAPAAGSRHLTTTQVARPVVPDAAVRPATVDGASTDNGRPAVRATAPLAGRTIVVDPGHDGGNAAHPEVVNRTVRIGNGTKACDTTGTESVRGLAEHRYTWSVAHWTRRALQARGARVVLTRPDDHGVGPCITRRMPRANALHADRAVSIHADGGPPGGRGFHVILPGRVPQVSGHDRIVPASARFGRAIRAAFRSGTGMPYATYLGRDGLDVRTDLGGLNLLKVPGVMIETGNMRNATDARRMSDPAWRRRAGEAIAAGIAADLVPDGR